MKRLLLLALPLMGACGSAETGTVTDLHAEADCVVTAGSCAAVGEALRAELQLPPDPEPLKPLAARVRVLGDIIDAPVLELSMVGMDMGDNRYRMIAGSKGEWTATIMLPVCVQGRADWTADIIVHTKNGRYRARFPFSTGG